MLMEKSNQGTLTPLVGIGACVSAFLQHLVLVWYQSSLQGGILLSCCRACSVT